MQKGKWEIFEKVTGDYVSKALDLGYSFEDIVSEISKKMNKGVQ